MLVLFFFLLTLELILFKISMSKNLSHLGDQMVSLTLIYKNKKNFERIWWVTLRLLTIRLIESKSSKGTIPLIRSINVNWCWSATTDQIESISMFNDESRWTLDGSSSLTVESTRLRSSCLTRFERPLVCEITFGHNQTWLKVSLEMSHKGHNQFWYKSGLHFFTCSTVGNSSMRYFTRDLFLPEAEKEVAEVDSSSLRM